MALSRITPNQYIAEDAAYSTSTAAESGHKLLFNASRLYLFNDKSVPVYLTFQSTDWSTGGHRTCAGESQEYQCQFSEFAVAATGTSTAAQVRLFAVGN